MNLKITFQIILLVTILTIISIFLYSFFIVNENQGSEIENDIVNNNVSLDTKISNELMARTYYNLYGLNSTGLRFFTVYGPWGRPDMAAYIFANKIHKNKPIPVFNNGNMKRDFTFITDIVSGIKSALVKNYECEIFNLGNGRQESLLDLISLIEKSLGKKAKIDYQEMQSGDVKVNLADINNARMKLNYNPNIRLSIGIPKFIEWFKMYKCLL